MCLDGLDDSERITRQPELGAPRVDLTGNAQTVQWHVGPLGNSYRSGGRYHALTLASAIRPDSLAFASARVALD